MAYFQTANVIRLALSQEFNYNRAWWHTWPVIVDYSGASFSVLVNVSYEYVEHSPAEVPEPEAYSAIVALGVVAMVAIRSRFRPRRLR